MSGKTAVRDYGSEYEKAVMTMPHPEKTQFRPLDPPPYVADWGYGTWLGVRREELVVIILMLTVIFYCACVYTGVYFTFVWPMMRMIGQAWDAALCSYILVKYAPLDRKLRKKARLPLLALCFAIAVARWYEPALYPSFYPWQPVQ